MSYLAYTYDPANRLVATYTTNSSGSTFLSQTSGRTYDAAGRVLASPCVRMFSRAGALSRKRDLGNL